MVIDMKLEFCGKSDIGQKREINQDMLGMYQKEDAGLFVAADGMGGHTDGEKASRLVVAQLADWWKDFSPDMYEYEFRKMIAAIEQTIEYANEKIYKNYNRNGICGTTVVVLFIYQNRYAVVYAGDSRCYLGGSHGNFLWRKEKWEQLTTDEVWENQSCLSRAERKMKNHPNMGKLVNGVGIRKEIRCRVITDIILPDAVFLLCTDGLYKFCSDRLLRACVQTDWMSPEPAVDKLIEKVYKNGADDNITVIIVKCQKE